MNKPKLCTFRCIMYRNSSQTSHKIKCISFRFADLVYTLSSIASNLLYPPRSSLSPEVLTSFVLPAHNLDVSYALLWCHAPWKIFLPTTGSFFVLLITDSLPVPALCSVDVICYIQLYSVTVHMTASTIVTCLSYAACR